MKGMRSAVIVLAASLLAGCSSNNAASDSSTTAQSSTAVTAAAEATTVTETVTQDATRTAAVMSDLRQKVTTAGVPCGDDAWQKDWTAVKGADDQGVCSNAVLLVTYVNEGFNQSDALLGVLDRQLKVAAAGYGAPIVLGNSSSWYVMCPERFASQCSKVPGATVLSTGK